MPVKDMIKFRKILYLILPVVLFGCSRSGSKNNYNPEEIYRPEYASGFKIMGEKGDSSVMIESYKPWQGAENDSRRLFIRRNGESVPVGFDGIVMEGDAKRVICMSSGHIAMIEKIGKSDVIVGGSSLEYLTSPELRKRIGEMADIGYEGAYNYESLVAANPDLVIIYGVNGVSPIEPKLKELGIPYMYVGDYLEEKPLGKTEWMIAIGECLGIREHAISSFKDIETRYKHAQQLITNADKQLLRPKVMLNAPCGGSWFLPPVGSYMAKLIEDAGGEYVYKGTGNTSKAISDEEALVLLNKADVWLNPGREYKTLGVLTEKVANSSNTKCVKDDRVWDNTLTCSAEGGNDFFEGGIVNPDLILKDLIWILHGIGDGKMRYYVRIRK